MKVRERRRQESLLWFPEFNKEMFALLAIFNCYMFDQLNFKFK